MDLETTWWLLGTGLAMALSALAGDRARKRAPLAWHAHLPWNGIIFAGMAVMLFALAHLTGLLRAG